MRPLEKLTKKITQLPRGGFLVNTKAGYIQFGAPPETIKDTMSLPESVPHPEQRAIPGVLITEDADFENVYIIRKGEVIVSRGGKPVAVLKKGDIVGAMVKLDRKLPSEYTFSHDKPVLLYAVKRKDYEKFIERNPGLMMKLAYNFDIQ